MEVKNSANTAGRTRHDGLGLVITAAHFSAWKHRDQRRKDAGASPYINHPIGLAEILWNEGGVTDPTVLAAALLHDTIEDTETTLEELRGKFGDTVAGIVQEVTDVKWLKKGSRKKIQIARAAGATEGAKLVKLADKISNVRDMLAKPPEAWSLERRREYFDWAKSVVDQVRGTNLKLERKFDQLYRRKP